MKAGAVFSPDRMYRYELWRWWDEDAPVVSFIGLNPSTADEMTDDPTIRRCVGFAKRWGYGGLIMVNLFAFRATDPRDMRAAADPVGPDNDRHLADVSQDTAMIVAAWGTGGAYRDRGLAVSHLLGSIVALGPLYVRADAGVVAFDPVTYEYAPSPAAAPSRSSR